jgi:hypothetical protein
MKRYKLAKMDAVMWILTAIVFAVPVFFLYTEEPRLTLAAFGLLALCGAVWAFARPSHFEVTERELLISWPLRSRRIAREDIREALVVTRAEFQQRYGRSVRLGVGGLFGQFGWAWTNEGLVTTYISTLGPFVLLEVEGARPLLITPEEPDAFVAALED